MWKRYFAILAGLVLVASLVQSFAEWLEQRAGLLGALAAAAMLIEYAIRTARHVAREPERQLVPIPKQLELSKAEKFVQEYRKRWRRSSPTTISLMLVLI